MTLLLTDVVDSTRMAQELGDVEAAKVWAAHDRVARSLLAEHRGREIDKTDGFLLLFESVDDALDHATAYHRALAELEPPLQARAGIHVGEAVLTENPPDDVARGAKPLEVDGLVKPTAARIMSVALGFQTLLSADAAAELSSSRPIRSHGHWRLKGVAEPMELLEVEDADAPMVPPQDGEKVYRVVLEGESWRPAKLNPNNLPTERDEFVGRGEDLRALADRFEGGARLVSLLGIGGAGKTRLATHHGWTWLGEYPGGAWFCDLSDARTRLDVLVEVARVLGLPLEAGDPVGQLGRAIAARGRCLVIVDNCEQVVEHAAEALGCWLDQAPEARFLVTTREILGLTGEEALSLASLPREKAAALFDARARQVRSDFEPDEAVEELTALLDGLPLAIELAAARVRVMSPRVLLERMNERFRVLAGKGRRHARHQTLRATLDWSWDLLSPAERSALAQLSVFEGGFTLDAVEEVLNLDGLDDDAWAVDVLQALVDKSLVRQVDDGRFGLLVSVQEYAAERLRELGEQAAAEQRHGQFYASLGATRGPDAEDRKVAERANLEAACRRALDRADAAVAGECCVALGPIWFRFGPRTEAVEWTSRVRALPGAGEPVAGRLAMVHAQACIEGGRLGEAETLLRAAAEQARSDGNPAEECQAMNLLSVSIHRAGRAAEAVEISESALALAVRLGRWDLQRSGQRALGIELRLAGRHEDALRHLEAALLDARSHEDPKQEAQLLLHRANVHMEVSAPEVAAAAQREALEAARATGQLSMEASALTNLGVLAGRLEDLEAARALLQEALRAHERLGNRRGVASTLSALGTLHRQRGALPEALTAIREALELHLAMKDRRGAGATRLDHFLVLRDMGQVEEAAAELEAAWEAGRDLRWPQLESEAAGSLGELRAAQGERAAAKEWILRAVEILEAHGQTGEAERLRALLAD